MRCVGQAFRRLCGPGLSGLAYAPVWARPFRPGLCALRDARLQPRLVTARSVAVDDALARHLVDQRDGFLQRVLRAGQIFAVDCRTNVFQRRAQPRAELAVVLAVL